MSNRLIDLFLGTAILMSLIKPKYLKIAKATSLTLVVLITVTLVI